MAAKGMSYIIIAMLVIVNGHPLHTPLSHEETQVPVKLAVLSTVRTSDSQGQVGFDNRLTSVSTIHNQDPTTEDHNVSVSGQKTTAASELLTSISSSHDLGKRMRRGSPDLEEKLEKEILLELFALRLKYDKFFTEDMDLGLLSIVDSVERQLHVDSYGSGSHSNNKDDSEALKSIQEINMTPVLPSAAIMEQSGNASTNNTLRKERIKDIQGDSADSIMVKTNRAWPQIIPITRVQSIPDYSKGHVSTTEQKEVQQKLKITSLHTSPTTATQISTHSKVENKISARVVNNVPEVNPDRDHVLIPFLGSHLPEMASDRTTASQNPVIEQNEIGGESVNRESQNLAEDLQSLSLAVNNFGKLVKTHEMLIATTDSVAVMESTVHNWSVVGVAGDLVKAFGPYPNKQDHDEDEFNNFTDTSTRQREPLPFEEHQRAYPDQHSVGDSGKGRQSLSGESDIMTDNTFDERHGSSGKDSTIRPSTEAEDLLPLEKDFVDEDYHYLQNFTESWNHEGAHQGSAAPQNDHKVLASYQELIEGRLQLHRVFVEQQEKELEAWCSFVQSIVGDNSTGGHQNVLSIIEGDNVSVPEAILFELRNSLHTCENDLPKSAPVSPYFEGNELKDLALSLHKLRKIKRYVLCREELKCPNTEISLKGKLNTGIRAESPAGLLDRILSIQSPLIQLNQDSEPTKATRSSISGTDSFVRLWKQLDIQDTSVHDKGDQTAELFTSPSNRTTTAMESEISLDAELHENILMTDQISTKKLPILLGAEMTPAIVANNLGKTTEWSVSKALAKYLHIPLMPISLMGRGENRSASSDKLKFPDPAAASPNVFSHSNPLERAADAITTNPAIYGIMPDNYTLDDVSLSTANRSYLPSAEAMASVEPGGQLMRRFHVILYVSALAVGIALLTAGMCVKHRVHPAFGAHPRKVKSTSNRARATTPTRPAEYCGSCRAHFGRPIPSSLALGDEENSGGHNDDKNDGGERSPLLFVSDVSGSVEAAEAGDGSSRSSQGVEGSRSDQGGEK